MNNQPNRIKFCYCDFNNALHLNKLVELINHYMTDPMGCGCELSDEQEKELVSGLSHNKSAFILFVLFDFEIVGLATCFINFSTFKAKPYINIHDIIIRDNYRGKGLGKELLNKIIFIARKRDFCKVTLEVRDDNVKAKKLYSELGFKDTNPVMHFWTMTI